MNRRNLVIVRAGDKSLHPEWLAGAELRNWDLVISYFGNDPDRYRGEDIVRIDAKGPKWSPLHDMLVDHPEFIDSYDYIWLPDDDLAMRCADMNRFFDICRSKGLELAQPSLSTDSPVTHPLVLNNTRSYIRYTNFVEVMAPCFSAACLRRALPSFNATQSGWGLDWLWPNLVADPQSGIAIVDDVVIRHTRPLGGPNYDAMRAKGLSPDDELVALLKAHGVTSTRIQVHKVLWQSGRLETVRGRSLPFATSLAMGFLPALLRSPARWKLGYEILRLTNRPLARAAA